MLRRAGYLAITISLLISGALPMAWAANSRIQQARVRRIKACVVRIPSMGEPTPAGGPTNPLITYTSPGIPAQYPDPDAVSPGRSPGGNQLLFYTLQQRADVKPDGWDFVNPAAPPYATLEIAQRYGIAQGTPIKTSSAPYWEVVLSEKNYASLAEMDVIYVPICRRDVSNNSVPQTPAPTFFTEEQRRILTKLADSGVTIWVDWALVAPTLSGVMGGDELPASGPLGRNKNPFFTNLDFRTSSGAIATAYTAGHPLLQGPFTLDTVEATNVGSSWDSSDLRPSLGRVVETLARDMQPTCNFAAVVPTSVNTLAAPSAYIAAGRFGAGYVVATAGNVGMALNVSANAEIEDLKFAYNLCAWSTEVTAQQKNGRHTGQSSVQINGMIEQWSYPHLTPQAGGLWESYPPRATPLSSLPINPVSPLIIDNVVISANNWISGGSLVSELNAFEVRPEDDFDNNRFLDDPLTAASPANNAFADYSVGQSYDRAMGISANSIGLIYGLTAGEIPESTSPQGAKAYVFALGPQGLFSLPAPRPGLVAADYWNNAGVVKQAPAIGVKYNAAPGFAILPGNGGYTRAQIYAGGVITGTAVFGSAFNGKVVSWGVGANGAFSATPEWYYPPNQESNKLGLVSGPVVTANIVDEGSGAVDTMVFVTSCASGDVSGQQNASGAGDTTGKVEGFIVATRGDVLTFPKNTQQPGANNPNSGRRFVCARWIDVPPGQGQVPQARELMWDPTRHFEVRVMDKARNYTYMRFVQGDAGFNLLPDGTAGQIELPMPPTGFAAQGSAGVWDTTKYVFLADYSPLPQPVDQNGATVRPRFSPQTPYVRGLQQIVQPTGIAGGVSVGSDNRIYYGTGIGYMCSVKWDRGHPKFAWKMRGAGDYMDGSGKSQDVDPTSATYLNDYAFVSAPAAGRRIVFASRRSGNVYVMEPDATIRGKILPPPTNLSGKWPLTSVTGNEVMLNADHGVGYNANSPYIRSTQQPWGRLPNQFTVDPDTASITFNNMENFSLDLNAALSSDQVLTTYGIDTQGKPAVVIPWKFVGDPVGTAPGTVVVPLPVVAIYNPGSGEQWLSGPVVAGERIYLMGSQGIFHEFPVDPKVIDPSFPKRNAGIVGLNGYNVGNTTLYPPSGLVKTRNIAFGTGMPASVAAPAISEKFVAICTPRGLTTYAAPNVLVADSNRVVEATGDATAVASTDVVVKNRLNLSDFAIPIDVPAGFGGTVLTERQFLNRPAAVRKLNRSGSLTSLFNSSNGTVPASAADPQSGITENSVLADESYLTADTGNNRIVEFNPAGKVVGEWNAFQDPFSYLAPGETTKLSGPMDVQRWVEMERLGSTNEDIYVIHTLIADTGNFRVVEIVDKIRYQAGNFNSGSYVTVTGQVGADGQPVRWYHVLVWSSQTNAQGLKLRYRNAQRIFWPDASGNLIPTSTASASRVASASPPYLPDDRFLSYTMATVQGQTIQYPTTGVSVTGYNQFYGAPPASVIDRLPQAKPGGDCIVFLRGRYKLDETSPSSAVPVTGMSFDLREAKPGSPTNAERFRFTQGVIDPNVPIISEIADEVTSSGPASNNPVHRLNGVASIQRTIRSDVKFAPWTYGNSAPVRYPYFLVADVDGVWECRMLPGTSPPRFSLTMAFTNEDYAYVTGAGNGDPSQVYSTAGTAHTPGGRRFSAASARRMPNGLILIASRTGANELTTGGASNANSHWHMGADVFLLRASDYLTASDRQANSLTVPYLRVDLTNPSAPRHSAQEHGWQPDQWVQGFAGVPNSLKGTPSIRWRVSESADPTKAPTQRTQFTQFIPPGAANPSDLFGSYRPSQPAFADLVY